MTTIKVDPDTVYNAMDSALSNGCYWIEGLGYKEARSYYQYIHRVVLRNEKYASIRCGVISEVPEVTGNSTRVWVAKDKDHIPTDIIENSLKRPRDPKYERDKKKAIIKAAKDPEHGNIAEYKIFVKYLEDPGMRHCTVLPYSWKKHFKNEKACEAYFTKIVREEMGRNDIRVVMTEEVYKIGSKKGYILRVKKGD